MNVQAYSWNDDSSPNEIERIIQAVLGEDTEVTVDSIQGSKPRDHLPTDIVICFGKRVFTIVSAVHPNAVSLPELNKLWDEPSNRVHREKAWEVLKGVRDGVVAAPPKPEDLELELKPEDLAVNLSNKLQNLQSQIKDSTHWIGTTVLGKKVLLSSKPINNIPCDYQLTFEELYAAKLAVEILGLQTLTLIKGK